MEVNFVGRMYKKRMSVSKAVRCKSENRYIHKRCTHTMTKELPTTPPTQNTVNMERKEAIFDNEGFHKLIIGTAIAVSTNAHNTMTQSSRIICEKE